MKIGLARATFALLVGVWTFQSSAAAGIGGPLRLADEGSFFVGGHRIQTDFAGTSPGGPVPRGSVTVGQMYVHFQIPEVLTSSVPIVLVHGGGLTGASFETTPDGREGWATYFVRKGHAVYVVDTPGRGRAGFDATGINRARMEGNAASVPSNVLMITSELAWTLFRFGPDAGTPFPDTQFPTQDAAAFASQAVPFGEATLDGGAMKNVPPALVELLDRIGPAVLFVHSLSGPFADVVVGLRPRLVKAVVNIEGAQTVVPTEAQIAAYAGVPDLEVFGDHTDALVFTGKPRLDARQAVVDRINAKSPGAARLVRLPTVGIHGNSHMMMQDRNNLAVADFILAWLDSTLR